MQDGYLHVNINEVINPEQKEINFKEGYELLKNSELIEAQEELDIVNLMKIVEESMTAYKACKSRVEAVQ